MINILKSFGILSTEECHVQAKDFFNAFLPFAYEKSLEHPALDISESQQSMHISVKSNGLKELLSGIIEKDNPYMPK